MSLYVLIWSFVVPGTEHAYIEHQGTFKDSATCHVELQHMRKYMDYGDGECLSLKKY